MIGVEETLSVLRRDFTLRGNRTRLFANRISFLLRLVNETHALHVHHARKIIHG